MLSMSIAAVIPAFNAKPFIVDALDSVSSQTTPVDEIIVIDDGSEDGTADAVRAWAIQHPFIPLTLHTQTNAGVSAARNAGIQIAKSTWIAFLDADDIWLPEHNTCLKQTIHKYPNVAFVFGNSRFFSKEAGNSFYKLTAFDRANFNNHCEGSRSGDGLVLSTARELLTRGSFIATCSTLVRRDALIRVGAFPEGQAYGEDRLCWLRLMSQHDTAACSIVVSLIRRHSNNVTHPKNSLQQNIDRLSLCRELIRDSSHFALSTSATSHLVQLETHHERQIVYFASKKGIISLLAVLNNTDLSTKPRPRDWLRSIVIAIIAPFMRKKIFGVK